MWGQDAHGLIVLTDQQIQDFRVTGAFIEFERTFTFAELFLKVFPHTDKLDSQTKQLKPNSLNNLRRLAKSGSLKFGMFKIEEHELVEEQTTNQDFCIISMGKKNRAMVLFKDLQEK